jgi:hypothetical protein
VGAPVVGGGPARAAEVLFARWRGMPPVVTLTLTAGALVGTAMFHRTPVPQFSRTFEVRRMRVYVSHQAADRFRAILTGPAVGTESHPRWSLSSPPRALRGCADRAHEEAERPMRKRESAQCCLT